MAIVRAHFNTFYNDGTPSTIYYTERRSVGTEVSEALSAMSQEFSVVQNYPNPFNPSTVICFQLPVSSRVTLQVFDVNGREVATLVEGEMAVGTHGVTFALRELAGGIYFYQLTTGKFSQTRKAVSIK